MHKTHNSIHFVGIKGVGMAALAVIAKQAGITVTGSDVNESFITDELLHKNNIDVYTQFQKEHIEGVDLVITTGAHGGYQNEEVVQARASQIPVLTQGEAVGAFMKGELFVARRFKGISVAGSHGKTTTTAMIATILAESGADPSYVVGTGQVPSLEGPGHLGNGNFLVVEADEYATEPSSQKKAKFLWQDPRLLVLTNIDFDHPDIYESIEDIEAVYKQFVSMRKKTDIVVAFGDDRRVRRVLSDAPCHVVYFGYSKRNDYVITNTTIEESHMFISVEKNGVMLDNFLVKTPGTHNSLNAAAAIATCTEAGIQISKISEGIKKYTGSKRRMERIGRLSSGALVFDDYAHHPKEIQETLKAFRLMYPHKQITVFFQPHTYSRTKSLFDDFVSSFEEANIVGLMDVFSSKREEIDSTVSSERLVSALVKQNIPAVWLRQASDVLEYIDQNRPGSNDILIFMGAGDVYKAAEKLEFEKE